MTAESFMAWKVAYEKERAAKAKAIEDEYLSKLSSKEREEYKRRAAKPTGKELFSKGGYKEDDKLEDEDDDAQEVDWSLYSRENREGRKDEEEETGLVTISDEE